VADYCREETFIGQRLSGTGKIAAKDEMVGTIEEILCAEPMAREVHREE
jgi:hypothetical protein